MESIPAEHSQLDLAEIAKRLRSVLGELNMSAIDFSAQAGTPYSTFRAYTKGDRPPSPEFLSSVFLRWGYMPSWMLTGVEPRRLADMQRLGVGDEFVVVPHYAVAASAGNGAINTTEISTSGLSFSRSWLTSRGLNPVHLRVIDVTGESMETRLSEGDKVLVDISDTTPKSGRAYVLRQGAELLVKYCQLLPEGLLRVSSENPKFPTYDIDLTRTETVAIIGRVRASTHEW